jgi:hypothetical protein
MGIEGDFPTPGMKSSCLVIVVWEVNGGLAVQ